MSRHGLEVTPSELLVLRDALATYRRLALAGSSWLVDVRVLVVDELVDKVETALSRAADCGT